MLEAEPPWTTVVPQKNGKKLYWARTTSDDWPDKYPSKKRDLRDSGPSSRRPPTTWLITEAIRRSAAKFNEIWGVRFAKRLGKLGIS
ncbi:hypothetical protein KIN20_028533 [Parelaphostrongylus tenuis]|uniref:Uncharacterized protein n=1 Tax=Parelaphostrongylus tenuis TaxID=148309 RepID=A0AAD5R0Y7_PARTN|nr:hypothetical protein KIN20_028533 [Parelaphostrongylus tenuis]